MMTPLKLTWHLATPLAGGAFPSHLDSVVAYAVTEEALRSGKGGNGRIRDLAAELPLGKAVRGDQWCWQASALQGDTQEHALRLWTRKFDPYDYADRLEAGKIAGRFKPPLKPHALIVDTVRGLTKNHFQFIPVRHVESVTAWCLGEPGRLLELLSPESGLVTALGARTRAGFGKITEFSIEEDEGARERWTQRILPWQDEGLVPISAAHHPPYWAGENRTVQSWVRPELLA